MVEAILFDFDLTLADSSAGVTECANHALRALDFAPAEPVLVHRTIGLSLVQSFRALTGNDDPGLGAAYAKHFGEHADRVMAELISLYPGAADTIRDLRGRGLRTAIVSTKFRYRIEDILKRADSSGLVDVIVGGEDVAQHKPHPESLLRALRLLDVHPSRAVYVGDHPVDAQAAASAEIPFIGVLTGAMDAESWVAFAPLRIITSVTELPAVLE
jgi:phosphoglycolate phosphatase